MTLLDNGRRHRNARHALDAYRRVTDTGDHEETLSDLIADLGHYADQHSVDFLDCCARAIAAWAVERQEPDATPETPSVITQIGGAS